jgi:hypothetical protein
MQILSQYIKNSDIPDFPDFPDLSDFITQEQLNDILSQYDFDVDLSSIEQDIDGIKIKIIAIENDISGLLTALGEETKARIQADNTLQTNIDAEESNREIAINNLQNALALKEVFANKINEIVADSDLKFYNTADSIYKKFLQIATNLQNVSDLIPYVSQSLTDVHGDPANNVPSLQLLNDALESIEGIAGVLHPKGKVDTESELPNDASDGDLYLVLDTGVWMFWMLDNWYALNSVFDLSNYATNEQVEASILDKTGDLVNLDTTDKTSLVGATNENHARINNNVNSIAGLQTDFSNASQSIVNLQNDIATETNNRMQSDANLQNDINTRAKVSDLNTTNTNITNLTGRVTTAEGNINNKANTSDVLLNTGNQTINNGNLSVSKQDSKY